MAQKKGENCIASLHGVKDVRVMACDYPRLSSPNEVIVQIASCGICGSDTHYHDEGKMGSFTVSQDNPMTLGHEAAGTVIELGSNVTQLQVGDRVSLEPLVGCRYCGDCQKGRYNLCVKAHFMRKGVSEEGSFSFMAPYAAWNAHHCYKLPDAVSFDEGALVEVVAVALHALNRGQVSFTSRVLVIGTGTLGLACIMVAKAAGVTTLVGTDIRPSRLPFAVECGASGSFSAVDLSDEEFASHVDEQFGATGPDVVLECSGVEECQRRAIQSAAFGGTVVCIGLGDDPVPFPLFEATIKELNVMGIFSSQNCFETALELMGDRRVDAFACASERPPGVIKVMVDM